ncbi:hypothetical protein ACGFZC_16045 [[Kitasatospora] papulosa]|uniref:hypothetical protein n=1 Tax=[Kitasatospora] papulosa TaxID=1464011 RepID=UPI003724A783
MKKFKRGQAIYDKGDLTRSKVLVSRYTAHGLIEIKDEAGRKGWVNPDDARAWAW